MQQRRGSFSSQTQVSDLRKFEPHQPGIVFDGGFLAYEAKGMGRYGRRSEITYSVLP